MKDLRATRSWTQEQLGTTVGVSRYAINALETSRRDPSLDLAVRIAAAFGLGVEEVFPDPHFVAGGHHWLKPRSLDVVRERHLEG